MSRGRFGESRPKMSKKCPGRCPAALRVTGQMSKKCKKNVPGLPEMSNKCPGDAWGTF